MAKSSDDQYSQAEARKRMEAALRGARIAGHKAMKDVALKRHRPSVIRQKSIKKEGR
jgi:hypothetical protein